MRFVVVQFSAYLTEFRKYLLTTRYGVALRNLIFVKTDRKLYFLDNGQNEHCLSHPSWGNVQGRPVTFPPEAHTHPYADQSHTHPYADQSHTHPYADQAHTHPYADQSHTHPYADQSHTHNGYAADNHTHSGYAALVHTHQRIVGEIVIWSSDGIPGQWLACNGQAVSRSTYIALFTMIGTTYGSGDGSTTFNVPDLRGRFPLGQDDMGGSSANRVTATQADNLGQGAGAETHTLTESEMPSHTHVVYGILTNAVAGSSSRGTILNSNNNTVSAPTGGGGTHNNMPPYLTLNYIIYAGV